MSKSVQNITLKQLYNNKPLFTKVEALIDKGETYDYILEFLEDEEHPMSRGTLANLKSKMKEAHDSNVDIGNLIDRRQKTSISQVDKAKIEGFVGDDTAAATDTISDMPVQVKALANNKFWSTEQVLNTIIEKGMRTLDNMDAVDYPILLKAVDMMDKNHGQDNHGLSLSAIKQYQVIMEARLKAMSDTFLQYVPKDKQDEAWQAMSASFNKALEDVEVTPNGKALVTALKKEGLDL